MTYLGETLSILAALSWAVGVVLFKKSGDSFSPVALNIFKNAVAIVLFVPTFYMVGESFIPDQPLRVWVLLSVSGVLGITVADTLFFMALNKLGAGLTAVVDTSYAPIMLLLSFFFLGDPMGASILLGAVMIAGAMVLGTFSKPDPRSTQRDLIIGSAIGVMGIAIMGFSIVIIKDCLNDAPHIWATTVRTVAAEIGLCTALLTRRSRERIIAELKPSLAWKTAVPASFFGTYLALAAWIGGMKYTYVSVASLLNQLSTVFIFILATVVLKEPLTKRRGAAIVLAFAGASVILFRDVN